MKALTYTNAHVLADFSLRLSEMPRPLLNGKDVLVRVRATAVNPVDYKIRRNRSGTADNPVILGWDASGVIEEIGPDVQGFQVGDEVYYAGDLTRAGSYAELQAVDHRLIAKKPKNLSFAEAAALPLTSLTAFEALLDRPHVDWQKEVTVLIIGGAGGVGSLAIQLLKAKTEAKVIATASRPESVAWAKSLGADHVIDHRKDLTEGLKSLGIGEVDLVFVTTQTQQHIKAIPSLLRPFGHLVLIEDQPTLDIALFMSKGISVHWELMFTKSLYQHRVESQGKILEEIAALVDSGKIKTTLKTILNDLTGENLREAHRIQESGKAMGKTVIAF